MAFQVYEYTHDFFFDSLKKSLLVKEKDLLLKKPILFRFVVVVVLRPR